MRKEGPMSKGNGLIVALKERAAKLKKETYALYLAYRTPETPLLAKIVAIFVVAYALSPIDLIPDFIPVLGYLDDLLLVPLGIALAIRLIPKPIMERCRADADARLEKGTAGGKVVAGVIIALWAIIAALVVYWVVQKFV